MKKMMNFRYFFILALSMIVATTILTNFLNTIIQKIIFLLVVIAIILLVGILIFTLKTKLLYVIGSICIIVLLLCINTIFRQVKISTYLDFDGKEIVVSGRISNEYTFTSSGSISFILDDVTLTDEEKSCKTSGNLYVYINAYGLELTNFEQGRYINFVASFNSFDMSTDGNSYLSRNIIGRAINNTGSVTITDRLELSLKEKIKNFVYQKFEQSGMQYTGLAIAMIFGDSGYIDEDIQTVFRDGGIAHLLAVSGLNISFLLSLAFYLMKRVKQNNGVKLTISIILLTFYSYLCDFTISVLRAAIMAIIQLVAEIRGKPYDRLSSVSFVTCLFLFVNPLKLYNYSFILSIFAVFVIILFEHSMEKVLNKYFYKGFSSSFALCISVQFGLSILQIYLFGYLPILSLFSNLLCVPLAVYSFTYLLVSLALSILLPFMSFSLKIFDVFMDIIVKFTAWINRLNLMIRFENLSIIVLLLFMLFLFNSSRYSFKSKTSKIISNVVIIISGIIFQTIYNIIS